MTTGDAMPDGPATGPRSFAAPARRPGGRRRRLRIILSVLGGLVALGVVLLALAPTIAGSVGRGYVESAINSEIPGSVRIGRLSLSWRGPQEVGEVVLLDPAGGQVSTVTVRATAGLWGLLMGRRDLGTVRVTGGADLIVGEDGKTNLERAVAGKGTKGSKPTVKGSGAGTMKLPAGIGGKLVIDGLDIAYTDPRLALPGQKRGGTIVLPRVNGEASFEAGKPLEGFLSFEAISGPSRADAKSPVGSAEAKWTISGLIDAQGVVTPSSSTVEASAEIKDLSVPVADAVLAQRGRLDAMLGPTLGVKLTATGAGNDLRADLVAASPRASLNLGLRYTPTEIESVRTGTIKMETGGLAVLAPGVFTESPQAGGGTLAVDQWPRAELTVGSLRVPLAGGAPDWATASGKVTIRAGDAAGRIAVGGGDDGAPRIIAVKMKPLTAVVESKGLASGMQLAVADTIEVDGHQAGDLSVDLKATNLVTAGPAGAPGVIDPSAAMLDGVATLSGFDTRAAQPFVQALGVRLPQDVGPEVDIELTAAGRIDPESSLPETTVELRVTGAMATATAEVEVENGIAKTMGDGIKVESRNAGPLVSRLAVKSGVRIQGAMPVRLSATDVKVDLARALRKSAGGKNAARAGVAAQGPDLRGAGGALTLWIGQATGAAPLTPGGPARPFRLAESTVTLDTTNIAQGVNLRTKLAGDLDGKPAGTIDATVAILGLLDPSGAVAASPAGPVRGRVSARGVSTALLQSVLPQVDAARVNLPTDLGLAVDLAVAISQRQGSPQVSDIEVTVKSDRLTVGGMLNYEAGVLRSGEKPLAAALRGPGPLLSRWLPTGMEAMPGGSATASIAGLSMPVRPAADPLGAVGRVEVAFRAVTIKPRDGEPLEIGSSVFTVESTGKGPLKVGVDGSFKQGPQAFGAKGSVQIDGLLGAGPGGTKVLTPGSVVPRGSITISDAPVTLLAFSPAGAQGANSSRKDLIAMLGQSLGPKVTIGLNLAPAQGAASTDLRLTAAAAGGSLDLGAVITPKQIVLRDSKGELSLTPAGVGSVLAYFAPDWQPRPGLKAPAKMPFTLTGLTVPRDAAGWPDLARAGSVAWTASVPGRLSVTNLGAYLDSPDAPSAVDGLAMSGSVPVGALMGGGAGDLKATLSGGLVGADGKTGSLTGDFGAKIQGGRAQGPATASLKVKGLDTRWADALAGKPGAATGLLGPSADVDVSVSAEVVSVPANGKAGTQASYDLGQGLVTASLASPTFSTSAPAVVKILADRFELNKAMVVKATVSPQWANSFLLGAGAAMDGPPEPSSASFTEPTQITINLPVLVVARGEGPMKPGVFSTRAIVDSPKVSMILGDGPAAFVGVHADVSGGEKPGVLGFSMRMAEAGTPAEKADPGAPPAAGSVRFAGGLYGVCDDAGRPTFDAARITATGKAPEFNTAVLDAMAGQGGLLLELLGPRVSLDVDLGGFSRETGKIGVKAVSSRASASLKGTMQHGVLVASEPATAELKEVTKELGARLSQGLPLIGVFEKRPEDGPATLKATGLRAPINHDLTQFDGDLLLDFGTARFQTSGAFSSILKVVGAKGAGEVGRKLAPLDIKVRSGVISYDRYTLPLGEFTVQTQGTVDLVNRRIDFVTFIPLGALTDEAAGMFSTGLGRLLGGAVPMIEQATMIPWRTRGPMDNPTTTPEVGLFLQNAGQSLLTPGSDLIKGIRDLFGGGGK